jgi:hypothetical protein
MSPPARAAWIETAACSTDSRTESRRRPRVRRGLKQHTDLPARVQQSRRPRGRRGLKHRAQPVHHPHVMSPPARAAWIETSRAPILELGRRGSKGLYGFVDRTADISPPVRAAWIETRWALLSPRARRCRRPRGWRGSKRDERGGRQAGQGVTARAAGPVRSGY